MVDCEKDEELLEEEWSDKKSALMEMILGKQHDMVCHSIVSYEVGGPLDLYYYPNRISGTGVATQELTSVCRDSSRNKVFSKYELVMFTKHQMNLNASESEDTPFGKAHHNINAILNLIAPYCQEEEINPGETLEFPPDMEIVGGKCLIFDSYGLESGKSNEEGFGLMLVMEIFRDEMEFAMKNGSNQLFLRLKEKNFYPYSDLDRPSVIKNP